MRPYEVMVILDASLEDADIQTTLEKASQTLSANGGVVNRLDPWGRRRLAYEIDHKHDGYYALYEITAEPAAVSEMDRVLRLDDKVMRHKVIRIPDHVAGRRRSSAPVADEAAPAAPEEEG